MKKRIILLSFLVLVYLNGKSQDSVVYYSDTKVVLEHFSEQFKNQHKVILFNSFMESDNISCYNIFIVSELSQALRPQPLFYYKYKNLIILYRNSHYSVEHSKNFLITYIDEIKKYIKSDIEIESYVPFKTKRIYNGDNIETGGATEYYCYRIQYEKILTFNKTTTPYSNPCLFNQSY